MHDESGGADRSSKGGSSASPATVHVESPKSVPLNSDHRIADFKCTRNPRIQDFFTKEWPVYSRFDYCRVFILPDPNDATGIFGYYTLSASLLLRDSATGSDQRRIPGGIAVSLVRIGFMGRHDDAPKGLGKALVVDAARRVCLNPDIGANGLMLDSDGGRETTLWEWYKKQGFIPAKNDQTGVMYAPLKRLIPEFGGAPKVKGQNT